MAHASVEVGFDGSKLFNTCGCFWRDAGSFGPGFLFSVAGRVRENGEDDPRAKLRAVSPGYFATLGLPLMSGRDFTDEDRQGTERWTRQWREGCASLESAAAPDPWSLRQRPAVRDK